jgi:hypothetical protein
MVGLEIMGTHLVSSSNINNWTTLLLNMAYNLSSSNAKVVVISVNGKKDKYLFELCSIATNMGIDKVKGYGVSADYMIDLADKINDCTKDNILFYDSWDFPINMDFITGLCNGLKMGRKIDVLIIDGLVELEALSNSRCVGRDFKKLAVDLDIPVVVFDDIASMVNARVKLKLPVLNSEKFYMLFDNVVVEREKNPSKEISEVSRSIEFVKVK